MENRFCLYFHLFLPVLFVFLMLPLPEIYLMTHTALCFFMLRMGNCLVQVYCSRWAMALPRLLTTPPYKYKEAVILFEDRYYHSHPRESISYCKALWQKISGHAEQLAGQHHNHATDKAFAKRKTQDNFGEDL